ncbi:type IX secretion system plug protein [Sunxiuqinia sp. A32]|uniref:type IX secretion system plug protein n=1 Tax=Sunxiuqinia sp. A32 TaxID=3461496 RepID=UPI0040460013
MKKAKKTSQINDFFAILLFVILSLNSFAQNENEFYYQNSVYREEIKTVQIYREGSELSHPIYELGTDASLILKFDDLSGEVRNYYYTILHCDADWNESYILQNEYIEGFVENPLDDYAMSFNTTTTYVNYQLHIPNDRVNIKYSGNYILIVYEDQDMEKLVLTRRFHVLDPKVDVKGIVKKATFDPFKGDNQEVDFSIYHEKLNVSNPREDIKVVIMKNRRWDNAIRGLKPLFIKQNQLVYDYNKENVFKGGNEYRYFDIRTTRFNGENVFSTTFHRPYFHATLLEDEIRSNKKYFSYKEMNGNYVVESQDRVEDYDTECDYIFVHFTLRMDAQLLGGTVNVFGALTDWNANKSNEMTWNYESAAYELTLLLKQGYYNFQYVYVPEASTEAEEDVLEGSHVETENEYQIQVYHKGISGRYDELVGYQVLNSAN